MGYCKGDISTGEVLTRIYDVKGAKVLIRKDTSDFFISNEVIRDNTYRKLNICSTDIVMDIGLNIGVFTIYAFQKGAAEVYAYEPEVENFNIAKHNVKLNYSDKVYELNNMAVVGNHDKTRPFAYNVRKNKGCHSLIDKRGRKTIIVDCVNFNDILESIKPTVVKIDIEGGEYELIKSAKSFKGIRELIIEFHHAHLNDIKTRKKYREVTSILEQHFHTVDYRPETKGAWTTLIYCKDYK